MENSPTFLVIAYYHYTHIPNAEAMAAEHLTYCKSIGIRGRIYIAPEGINGTISGTVDVCNTYMNHLKSNSLFKDIEFKIDEHDQHAFNRIHVRHNSEIVHSGLRDPKEIDPTKETGKHISGIEFAAFKNREDVVVIDVRSNYETRLGKFKNSVTLDMDNFREFPKKINELEQYKHKKVITVCTGGIKCEKASAYLIKKGFKDVYQLHNGIIGYAKETGGKDFDGSLYVFDGRVSVDINHVNPSAIAACKFTGTP